MKFNTIERCIEPHAIETISGLFVDVTNPDPTTISINDIAWSLSRQARFAGHTLSERVWSVGQHSLFVYDLLELALEADGEQLHWSLREFLASKGLVGEFEDEQFSKSLTLLYALIHDGPEAYLVDLPSPIKQIPEIKEGYKNLERKVADAMLTSFGLRHPTKLEHALVQWADLLALKIEAANLLPSRGRGWGMDLPTMYHADLHLFPVILKWQEIAALYVKTFDELLAQAHR